ncbi:hypothetical protein [Lysinibacillus fusiformis]|uniref:hypothetical protein n=1 Tax=Lysinibacillus fusiformis TaxID=28031 RepID=UPI003D040F75
MYVAGDQSLYNLIASSTQPALGCSRAASINCVKIMQKQLFAMRNQVPPKKL